MPDSWAMLLLLGAFHGVNPAMGWLFAVALGMQDNRSATVWRALLPIGIGHTAAIAAAVLLAVAAGAVMPIALLRWSIAAFLVGFGLLRLVRPRHPRWGSMRLGSVGLAAWSFLVASAHGAGVMVLPVLLGMSVAESHGAHVHAANDLAAGVTATAVHSGSYLAVTALVAWVVFRKLGVGLLRTAWINLDVVWAVALIASGALTLLIGWS
jgi:hypothetical protein